MWQCKSVKRLCKKSHPFALCVQKAATWRSGWQTCSTWALLRVCPNKTLHFNATFALFSQLIMSTVLPPCSWPALSKGRGDIAAAKPAARPTRPGWCYWTGGVELKRSVPNSNRNNNQFRIRHTCICIGKLWQGRQTGAKG